MNDNNWQVALSITSICLFGILVFSVFVGFRAKSAQAGLRLFFLFFILVVVYGLLLWGAFSVPDSIWNAITPLLLIASTFLIGLSGFVYWLNGKKAGRIEINDGGTGSNHLLIRGLLYLIIWMVAAFLFVGVDVNGRLAVTPSVMAFLAAFRMCMDLYFALEVREKGFVYHASVIPFSNIKHFEWDHLLYKTNLKVHLKSSNKVLPLKIPGTMITPIDNFLRDNFPRP